MLIEWNGLLTHLKKGKIEILPGGVTVLTGMSASCKRSLLFLIYEVLKIMTQTRPDYQNQRSMLLAFLHKYRHLVPDNFRITDEKGNVLSFSHDSNDISLVLMPKTFNVEPVFDKDPGNDTSKTLCLFYPEGNLNPTKQSDMIKYLLSMDDIARLLITTRSRSVIDAIQECAKADGRLEYRTRIYYLDPPNTIDVTKNTDAINSFLV